MLGVWTQDLGPLHDGRGFPLPGASPSHSGDHHVIQWQVSRSDKVTVKFRLRVGAQMKNRVHTKWMSLAHSGSGTNSTSFLRAVVTCNNYARQMRQPSRSFATTFRLCCWRVKPAEIFCWRSNTMDARSKSGSWPLKHWDRDFGKSKMFQIKT